MALASLAAEALAAETLADTGPDPATPIDPGWP